MATLYTLKTYPTGRGRDVYRVMEVSGNSTLSDLCWDILNAFDFDDDHLYEFCMDNKMYSHYSYQSDPEYGGPSTSDIKLDDLNLFKGQKFSLHYDFGDDWMFAINVQKIEPDSRKGGARVIKEKGHIEQYPSWDDEDGDDDDEDEMPF